MSLTIEQWEEILDTVNANNGYILEQIKEELKKQDKDIYQKWEQERFDINYQFDVLSYSGSTLGDIKFALLHLAVLNDHTDMVQALLKVEGIDVKAGSNFDRGTPLHLAAKSGYADIVQLLLDEKAEINAKDDTFGYTPLHWAAKYNRIDIIQFLLDKKAEINAKDNYGNTPLHLAAEYNCIDIIQALLKVEGIDVQEKNTDGNTPLHLAAKCNRIDIIQALLKVEGIDVQEKNTDEWTLLHWAARYDHIDIVQALLDKKARVNEKDNHGNTPLHLAVRNGHLDLVEKLIEKKADIGAKNNNGNTPLHEAASYGHLEIAKVLLKNRANIDIKNESGKTALCQAIDSQRISVANLLIAHEIKLKGSDAQKSEYLNIPNTDLREKISEYWNKCLDEVKRMKQEKIDSGVTFYDVLVSKNNKLVSHIRKEGVRAKLKKVNYESEFPIYGNDLRYQFTIGKQRLDALRVGETVIKYFGNCMQERGQVNLKIAEYLSNEDIGILRKAAIQTMDEETSQFLDKKKNTSFNKSIIIGSVCGVIAALAVSGGCFAAGVTLPMLALIGIAVAAALVIGVIAGSTTYSVLKLDLDGPPLGIANQQQVLGKS